MKNFEEVRKKWLHAELELKKYKELLVKSDVAKAALEVKLKHARNQLDIEMKKRYKVEADYQYLVRLKVRGGNHGWLVYMFLMIRGSCNTGTFLQLLDQLVSEFTVISLIS